MGSVFGKAIGIGPLTEGDGSALCICNCSDVVRHSLTKTIINSAITAHSKEICIISAGRKGKVCEREARATGSAFNVEEVAEGEKEGAEEEKETEAEKEKGDPPDAAGFGLMIDSLVESAGGRKT